MVFTIVTDPVGNGYVESLARPGRNATGFMFSDYSLNAKYPELLKEIAPGITQVAVLRDASQGAGTGDFAVIQVMAPLLRLQVKAIGLREASEIESSCRGLCALSEWRSNHAGERSRKELSRSYHCPRSAAQAAGGIL